ncbi:DUF547 domain-containing protein [uncultured Algibacter sp.]|uniref:DUF547 domain-containing protein n=1 Tax=uncultured Algibacter sp. TaxID=298659 RepID=UPI0032179EA7
MKNIYLIFILIVLCACSSTKRVTETTTKEITVVVANTTKDSTVENTPIQEPVTKTLETPKPNNLDKTGDINVATNTKSLEAFNHDAWNRLLQTHVSNQGNVDYKGFKANRKTLLDYISALSKNTPSDGWKKEDKLAYWINTYNAMTVDLILRNYPIKSIKDIKDPWDQRFWKLGNKWYNLNDIEHVILRKMDEPRIHFGIVCASFSCPKLQNEAFTASKMESQLTKATKEFLSDSNRNQITENSLELSKIFQWFSKDFKQNGSLIDFLNLYTDIKISDKAKKRFKDYNWDLNE